ncbi:NhaP-type Na+/H+ or K+/H+ antiporter [Microbacterium keratanolyticum]|uniref:Potassium transporter Trk n=1 Tax=Microbacterium keratanolyticum TaxID=67574 RepID=A0A9W6HPU4_9MICO|nr:potassium transporter Trk [Microbacterium keratanolyticum]MBM7468551.1 NhaP-type Na+/H+ or K+/H+ antiporter [Microbacterium keratanolyticum]GLK00628.1 hypothetical protein GCM10017596_03430 [Microbacterium keratanolyticum]
MSAEHPTSRDEIVEARVRRVPRYGVLMAVGGVLGVLVAAIIALSGSQQPSEVLNVVYPPTQVFGFVLLWTAPIGIALGGLVGVVLERLARRHDRIVRVDHETIVTARDED